MMTAPFELIGLWPNILIFQFHEKYDLGMTFIRLSEFYENRNKEFCNQYFQLEQYMDYYVKNIGMGRFDYYSHYAGFNFGGDLIRKFQKIFQKRENPLRPKEESLINTIIQKVGKREFVKNTDRYYIIGFHEKASKEIKIHELSHAVYHFSPTYRDKAHAIIGEFDRYELDMLMDWLYEEQYADHVLADELVAYYSSHSKIKGLLFNELQQIPRIESLSFEECVQKLGL